jgi:hypothetical protein
MHGVFRRPLSVYVRGKAYLTAHQSAEAAAAFQKNHPGILVSDPVGALPAFATRQSIRFVGR